MLMPRSTDRLSAVYGLARMLLPKSSGVRSILKEKEPLLQADELQLTSFPLKHSCAAPCIGLSFDTYFMSCHGPCS